MFARYRDRDSAGRILAEQLAGRAPPGSVVAAIPRGGVPVARRVADRLGAPLTLAFARKLAFPGNPEFAFGAIGEDGRPVVNRATLAAAGVPRAVLRSVLARERAELARRIAAYGVRPLVSFLPAHPVVVVDDGLATGLTLRAVIAFLRRHHAPRIVVAVPCAPTHAARTFRTLADDFVCPLVDDAFGAVGAYYASFPQLTDADVLSMLALGSDLH